MTPPPRPKPTIVLGPKPADDAITQEVCGCRPGIEARRVLATARRFRINPRRTRWVSTRRPTKTDHHRFDQEPTLTNFSGGRVKAQVPRLGNTYSVELWFRNELPVDSRPVTAYVFSRAVEGVARCVPAIIWESVGRIPTVGDLIRVQRQRPEMSWSPARLASRPGSWSHVVMVRQDQKNHGVSEWRSDSRRSLPNCQSRIPKSARIFCWEDEATTSRILQGMLEEVALYDRALTPQEVEAHFDAAGVSQVDTRIQGRVKIHPMRRPPNQRPMEVGQALKTIHVRDGFEVQLVAAEPLVMDPVAIDWGPDGKLWVVEMADYPLGIDGQGKPGGRVRFLEDTNDDGQYDKSTLFADGLSFPNGVLAWGRGDSGHGRSADSSIWKTVRGDGKADVRRVLYSGFLEGQSAATCQWFALGTRQLGLLCQRQPSRRLRQRQPDHFTSDRKETPDRQSRLSHSTGHWRDRSAKWSVSIRQKPRRLG